MPDLENPQTYAEWYWKNSIDANELLESLKQPSDPGWENPLARFVSNVGSGLMNRVLGHEVKEFDYHMNSYLQNVLMTPEVANALMLRKKITPELWLQRMNQGGFKEAEANLIYETLKPYPSMPDIISWSRYAGDAYNPKELTWSKYDVSPTDWPMWEWLSRMKLTTEQVQTLYKRKTMGTDMAERELARIGWQEQDPFYIKELAYIIPNPMLLVQGDLMQGKSRETILNDISIADIHPDYAENYLEAVLTKPASDDLVAYELRKDPSLSQLNQRLQKIGVHPDYTDIYKELAYQIPPVADIITMAVREAFTPEIAARFGQYEDLPPDYIEWAQKKGLTKEWAERYWAAHWSLPSPQQGFEMLHRGVIGEADLQLLLRASDVMPFWRDKLIQIAYRPLTRVDVRRMFKLGVIDVSGVRKAYRDLGYNEHNADLMTKFTEEYVKGVPKKLSITDIITSYKKHLIEADTLRSLLAQAGIESEDIDPIIRTAEQRREWSDREDNIATVEYLYKQGKYNAQQTASALSNLRLSGAYIQNLIQQWKAKSVAERVTLWTTLLL